MTPVSPVGGEVDVERLREVAEAATPGPWECDETSGVNDLHFGHVATPVIRPMGYYGPRLNDARHIAAFDPPTVLALLARLDEAESARDEALAAVERVRELAATWLDTGLMLAGEYREAAHHIRAALTPSAPTEEER